MKAIRYLTSSCLTLFLIFFESCRTGGRCEEALVISSSIGLDFIDAQTKKYLYNEQNAIFNRDSLKGFTLSGEPMTIDFSLEVIPNTNNRFYRAFIGPIVDFQTDMNSFSNELCKDFILKYNYNESDTIKVCFKLEDTRCATVYESLNIFHNDTIAHTYTSKTFAIATIQKD